MLIKFLSLNINGIRSYSNWQFIKREKFDFIGFQEIKSDNIDQLKKYELDDYYCYWSVDHEKKGHSGCGLFTKYKPIQVTIDEVQGRYIILEYKTCFVITSYFNHAGEKLQHLQNKIQFIRKMNNIVSKLHKPLIIFGDFNVAKDDKDVDDPESKHHRPGFTIEERSEYTKFLNNNKLIDAYRYLYPNKIQYTYFSRRTHAYKRKAGWRIDAFLCSKSIPIKDVVIRDDVYVSTDHVPVILTISK